MLPIAGCQDSGRSPRGAPSPAQQPGRQQRGQPWHQPSRARPLRPAGQALPARHLSRPQAQALPLHGAAWQSRRQPGPQQPLPWAARQRRSRAQAQARWPWRVPLSPILRGRHACRWRPWACPRQHWRRPARATAATTAVAARAAPRRPLHLGLCLPQRRGECNPDERPASSAWCRGRVTCALQCACGIRGVLQKNGPWPVSRAHKLPFPPAICTPAASACASATAGCRRSSCPPAGWSPGHTWAPPPPQTPLQHQGRVQAAMRSLPQQQGALPQLQL